MDMVFEFEKNKWWQTSDEKTISVLIGEAKINSKFKDYLENLSTKEGLKIKKIESCEIVGNFIFLKVASEVELTNQLVEKEMVLTRTEKTSGGRCLLSFEVNDRKMMVSDSGESIVTFFPDFSKEKLCYFPKKIENELGKILGERWSVKKIEDLGSVYPFLEITPEKVPIFWIELSCSQKINIEIDKSEYVKKYDELSELLVKLNDAIALSIVGRKMHLEKRNGRNN
ncbi:hypothetical protein KKD37_02915 [Patescibacteria group bacterium]|nr:hypothetical protein [Patescibacteria group bacterium]